MPHLTTRRAAAVAAACLVALLQSSDAASPAAGTLSPSSATLSFTSGPFQVTDSNPTYSPPTCDASNKCDDYALTVDLPAGYAAAHPNARITITTSWTNAGEDYDLYLQDSGGAYLQESANGTPPSPPGESVTYNVSSVPGGGGTPVPYNVRVVPYNIVGGAAPSGTATTTITLDPNDSAPTGPGGTVSPAQPVQTHDAGPFVVSNPAAQGLNGPVCDDNAPCESYALTVELPAGYLAEHPNAAVKVSLSWTDAGGGASDYDLYIYKGNVPTTDGNQVADYQSAGGNNPEVTSIFPLADGSRLYTIKAVPFTASGETIHLKMELLPGSGGGGGGNGNPGPCDSPVFGGADKPCSGNPRYQIFEAPKGSSAEAGSQGEYNIGFNPKTGRILNMNIGPIWRITPAEIQPGGAKPPVDSGLPESCPEVWEDVSDPRTDTGLDPILITDPVSGRTFATNSTAGGVALYTDTDGGDPPANDAPNDDWIESGQPPNGGADHETFGVGPLPASLAALSNPTNQGQWVLYCSQDLVAPSMCQKSLTLGTAFENGFPATGLACAGLHGHARIAPDGTAWLPVKSCGATAGGSITIDASSSPWTEFSVEKTTADADGPAFTSVPQVNGADPSIGLDENSTAYYCYVNNEAGGTEGHVHVAVGKRAPGTTSIKWIRDVDVGATHGIVNAAHTEAVAGSAGRAACGFMGTNVPGNYQAGDFPGVWYVYVATTYDEGKTWVTVNATPNDPVQHETGVWQQGGGGQNGNRNLLDFNEVTMDDKGRVLYGYSDGCVSVGCITDQMQGNDRTAFMRVARQIGGKTLLASYDAQVTEPAVPKRACLRDAERDHPEPSVRDIHGSYLKWNAPDHNGSPILKYEIWRGTASGAEALLATTADAKTTYTDATADPLVADYYYKVRAISAQGTSLDSNELHLVVGEVLTGGGSPCALPGVLVATDAEADSTTSPTPGQELLAIYGAELYSPSAPDKLYMTLKVDTLSPSPPANTVYYADFVVGGVQYFLSYDTSAPPPPTGVPFNYGWLDTSQTPQRLTDCPNGDVALDPESTTTADGTILLVISKDKINQCAADLGASGDLSTQATLAGVYGEVRALVGAAGSGLVTTVDQTAPAPYTQVGNSFCAPNAAPVVDAFIADPTEGTAPLTVTFTVSAHDDDATDPIDTIKTYTFDFGDGSPEVAQAGNTVEHTYEGTGEFLAKVKVTDSRNLVSVNGAEVRVNVLAGSGFLTAVVGNNRLAGALSPLTLLALGLLALRRRRVIE